MKNTKKIFVVMLVAVITAAVFASCKDDANDDEQTTSTGAPYSNEVVNIENTTESTPNINELIAESAGPFQTLEKAVGDRNLILSPKFVDGGVGFTNESAQNLFDGDIWTKYCEFVGQSSFWAVWKYDRAYVADRFIFVTANDHEAWENITGDRRMGDGWTFSGADNADGPWTVLYTGKGEDYENIDFSYFFIDLPNNRTAYQYYKINSDYGYDSNTIQLSEIAATGN